MLKRTLLALGAFVLMCSAFAQGGYGGGDKTMEIRTTATMGVWADDYTNWDDDSKWMTQIYNSISARDRLVLQGVLWRLPGNEERTIRMALQKCHKGQSYDSYKADGKGMTEHKFMMSSTDVWNNTIKSLSTWERRNFAWTWDRLTPIERDALMNALMACCEGYATRKSSGY